MTYVHDSAEGNKYLVESVNLCPPIYHRTRHWSTLIPLVAINEEPQPRIVQEGYAGGRFPDV